MSSIDKGFSEKRDFIRMKINAPLSARIAQNQTVIEGLCRDLSGGGMQVETKTDLPVNTELEVEISSEHGHNPTLRARARVVRSQADAGNEGIILGLELLEILR